MNRQQADYTDMFNGQFMKIYSLENGLDLNRVKMLNGDQRLEKALTKTIMCRMLSLSNCSAVADKT